MVGALKSLCNKRKLHATRYVTRRYSGMLRIHHAKGHEFGRKALKTWLFKFSTSWHCWKFFQEPGQLLLLNMPCLIGQQGLPRGNGSVLTLCWRLVAKNHGVERCGFRTAFLHKSRHARPGMHANCDDPCVMQNSIMYDQGNFGMVRRRWCAKLFDKSMGDMVAMGYQIHKHPRWKCCLKVHKASFLTRGDDVPDSVMDVLGPKKPNEKTRRTPSNEAKSKCQRLQSLPTGSEPEDKSTWGDEYEICEMCIQYYMCHKLRFEPKRNSIAIPKLGGVANRFHVLWHPEQRVFATRGGGAFFIY